MMDGRVSGLSQGILGGTGPRGRGRGVAQAPAASTRAMRRAGQRKSEVLEAAGRVIAERGADATRFADVAAASGVPVSTLQYYFGNREDMLVAAFRHASETEIAATRAEIGTLPDPWDRLVAIIDRAIGGYQQDEEVSGRLWIEAWRFGMRDAEMRADVHRDYAAWRGLVAETVRAGTEAGRFTATHSPEYVGVLAIGLLDGLGISLAVGDPAVSYDEVRAMALDTLGRLLGLRSQE
jgi:AcrR family transcriptional regulator